MRGFRVHGSDGTERLVEATHYEVDEDGDLVLLVGEDEVEHIEQSSWVSVDAVGRPLSATWPPEDLGLLLDRLGWEAGVTYGYTEPVPSVDDFASPRLNDIDSFMARFTQHLGLDPDSTEHREMYSRLRDLIGQHFKLVP